MLRVRTVEEEFEADLTSPPASGSQATGKAERKRYAGGEQRLKIKARALPVADGTRIRIQIAGSLVAESIAQSGRISVDLTTPESAVPAVRNGDEIELSGAGRVLLRGSFEPE